MPELPEVEILVRHLQPLLQGRTIRTVVVHRPKVIRPDSPRRLQRALMGSRFVGVSRRAKFLVFTLEQVRTRRRFLLLGHLGMTGRMFLLRRRQPVPRHVAVELHLDRGRFLYEDTRYFGRLTLDLSPLSGLGPEPLAPEFTAAMLGAALKRSKQAIKIRLLDQSLLAGLGNIYASEALFRARISPHQASRGLPPAAVQRLCRAIRSVLAEAIQWGSTVPLNWDGAGVSNGLFYYGTAPTAPRSYTERLRVYDRAGQPCVRCRTPIRRSVQAGRSTYFCPRCQAG